MPPLLSAWPIPALKEWGPLAEAFGPFAEAFEETTGLTLEMFSLSNRTAAGTALQYDDVDLVFCRSV
ncbi:hypothetical protein DK37_10925 [Halomonas sp. SUBG004]|nr:hypothetical protein DK37_10925 [Halomonas sp. SUBG004]